MNLFICCVVFTIAVTVAIIVVLGDCCVFGLGRGWKGRRRDY